jgi:hypothetical protein
MTAFARITADHDALAFAVSPCARLLYRFLLRLRPAGQAIEFEIADFNQYVGLYRSRPFSEKWIKTAIAQLEGIGLVQVLKQFNAHCLKLIAVHPQSASENKTSEIRKNSSPFGEKTSKKGASKPDSAVPVHRENIENNKQPVVVEEKFSTNMESTTNTYVLGLTNLEIVADSDRSMTSLETICKSNESLASLEFVEKSNESLASLEFVEESHDALASLEKVCKSNESLAILEFVEENHNSVGSLEIVGESQTVEVTSLDNSTNMGEEKFSAPRQKESSELLKKAEDVGVILNPYVIGLIAKAEAEVVKNAIAALKEAKRKGTVKNPTGYLVKAIQQKWQPMEAKDSQSGLPHDFEDWYQKVIALGLVENLPPNYLSSDRNGEPFVRVRVPNGNCPYTLTPWREAMVLLQT